MRFLKRRANIRAPRRRLAPRWLKPALKAGTVAVVLGSVGFGLGWLWRAGLVQIATETVSQRTLAATAAIGLSVDDVLVVGRVETPRADVLAAIGVARGVPILAVDPTAARARLEQLPWIKAASVERRLPGTVFVHLTEREPVALWQRDGRLQPIDRDGKVVATADVERFGHLLIVVGAGAPAHTPGLIAMLAAEPEIAKRVSAAVRIGNRRWNLQLDNGVELRLPESDQARAWSWLANLDREHRVLARDVVSIDLRLPDRLIVRPTAEAPKADAAKPVKRVAQPDKST
ncbi:MAG: FtsQ-type POTRA domain-containing protein [Alphaproteobacteria bacterium]|nr:FtsQ-type POTRA domain-containing protein [Alphaproteobacteria bacterium]